MRSYFDNLLQWQDSIFVTLWITIIIFIAYVWRKQRYGTSAIGNYFMPALILRLVSGMVAGLVVEFYYNGVGDTKGYFVNTLALKYDFEAGIIPLSECFNFGDSRSAVGLFVFPLTYLTNDTYLATTLFFSGFAFVGSWRLYKFFLYFYPHLHKPLAYCTLFLPSIFYWGSGLIKDPLSFGGLGIMLYALCNIFFRRKQVFLNIFIVFASAWLVYVIKAYILVAAIPAISIWLSIHFSNQFKLPIIRFFILPLLILISLATAGFIVQNLTNDDSGRTASFSSKNVLKNIEVQQNAYTYGEQGGSYVNLGEFDGSISGFIRLFPFAVISTFFRPFPWEIKNVLMVFSALENLLLLYLVLKIFFTIGLSQVFRYIVSEPFLLFCVFFSVIFAGFVGSSTFNLGTLARYKIPCLPFIWVTFIVLQDKFKSIQANKYQIRRSRKIIQLHE